MDMPAINGIATKWGTFFDDDFYWTQLSAMAVSPALTAQIQRQAAALHALLVLQALLARGAHEVTHGGLCRRDHRPGYGAADDQ